MEIFGNPWFTATVAFILGGLAGWFARGAGADAEDDLGDDVECDDRGDGEPATEAGSQTVAPSADKVNAIETEISQAKALLEDAEATDDDLVEELEKLDQAVKRANGRLKLIMRAAGKAKDTE